jgi:hypothetical protein
VIRSRVLPALVVLLLAVAAAVWWTQVRFPARTERVSGVPQATLRVQDAVRASDLAAIRRGIALQQRALTALGAGGVTGEVEVRVADGDGCHAFATPGAGGVGQTEAGFVCLDLRAPAWAYERAREPLGLVVTPAHEWVHARQAELGCLADGDAQRWRWLFEGTAVALSYRAVEPDDAVRATTIRRFGAFARDVGPLARYETANGGDHAYALWHLAVRDLLRRTHRPPRALLDFCARARTGDGWRAAFRATFGIDVRAFYRAFAAARPRYARGALPL